MRHGGIFQFFIYLIVFSFLLDVYVCQGIKTLLANARKQTRRIVLWVYWVISIVLVVALLVTINGANQPPGMRPYQQWLLSIFIGLLVTKLFFALVLLVGDIYRLIAGLFNGIS